MIKLNEIFTEDVDYIKGKERKLNVTSGSVVGSDRFEPKILETKCTQDFYV
jgi:hypothetical protein